jgi:hypothetical protein
MADNVAVTAGSGVSIAADDIGGVHHQRVKIGVGADGTAVDMISGAAADGVAATPGVPGSVPLHYDGTNYRMARAAGTVGDGATTFVSPHAVPYLYNGATYDRQRGNTEGTLLASAARTTNTTSPSQTNYNARGVAIVLTVTVASGTGGLQAWIVGSDGAAGFSLTSLPTTVTTTGTWSYGLYPGVTGTTPMLWTSGALPRTWEARVTHGDASSYTYSLRYALIL